MRATVRFREGSSRYSARAALCFVLAGFMAAPGTAADAAKAGREFETCSTAEPGLESRLYLHSHGDTTLAVVESPDGTYRVCTRLLACGWSVRGVPRGDAAKVMPFDTGACKSEWRYGGKAPYHRNECQSAEINRRLNSLGSIGNALLGKDSTACVVNATGIQTRPGLYALVDGEPAAILQLEPINSSYCAAITIAPASHTTSLWFLPKCLNSTEDFSNSGITVRSEVVGGSVGKFTFALPIASDALGRTITADAGLTTGWRAGSPSEAYMRRWLSAVTRVAKAETPLTLGRDDPLPGASAEQALGRASRWIVAAMMQIQGQPFSALTPEESARRDHALRWMALQALTEKEVFQGTLLRGEIARSDWNNYEKP